MVTSNRLVLVTGATSSIGLAAVTTLKENGFDVVLTGRNAAKVADAARETGCPGYELDVAREESCLSIVRQVEQDLQAQLQQIEMQLAELQNQQGDGADVITLTPEVEAKLLQFQQEKLTIRKKLRDVQHQLNKDIEQLDFTLKLINIALVPLLLTVFVIVVALVRRRKAS